MLPSTSSITATSTRRLRKYCLVNSSQLLRVSLPAVFAYLQQQHTSIQPTASGTACIARYSCQALLLVI
jgi:hypothetical protein